MATQRMNESWDHVKNQIQSVWSKVEFGDKEMNKARGNMRKMVELIHEKTGEEQRDIFQKISAII